MQNKKSNYKDCPKITKYLKLQIHNYIQMCRVQKDRISQQKDRISQQKD